MMCAPSFALFPSFYSQLRTSPLDTGPEQVHTCSRQPLKAEDERLLPPPSSRLDRVGTLALRLPPFLSRTDHERVARSAATVEGHAYSGTSLEEMRRGLATILRRPEPPDRVCLSLEEYWGEVFSRTTNSSLSRLSVVFSHILYVSATLLSQKML